MYIVEPGLSTMPMHPQSATDASKSPSAVAFHDSGRCNAAALHLPETWKATALVSGWSRQALLMSIPASEHGMMSMSTFCTQILMHNVCRERYSYAYT